MIGISSPRGIIPLTIYGDDPLKEVPFKEAEYLVAGHRLSIQFLLTLHNLVEFRFQGESCHLNHLLICLFFTHSGSSRQKTFILRFWLVRPFIGLRGAGCPQVGKTPS